MASSADEPGSADHTSTTSRTGTGKTQQAVRGRKRVTTGDDYRYNFECEEDKEAKRSSGSASSSKTVWNDKQSRDLSALADESRESDMQVVRQAHSSKIDLREIYLPPRIVTVAEAAGLRKGFSFHLTCKRARGMHWDFSVVSTRKAAIEMIRETKP